MEAATSRTESEGRKFHTLILRDITQRQQTETALRNSEKLAATGRLAAMIAHEINNPLESITNVLYLLDKHPVLDATARRYLEVAQQELSRVVHITKQTLGFYREANSPARVELAQVMDDVLAVYERRVETKKVAIDKRYESQGVVQAFPGEMRQVFSNLVLNALDAVGPGGRISLHVTESRDWAAPERRGIRVVVADSGRGISQ